MGVTVRNGSVGKVSQESRKMRMGFEEGENVVPFTQLFFLIQ
jgi:hypothetical protein